MTLDDPPLAAATFAGSAARPTVEAERPQCVLTLVPRSSRGGTARAIAELRKEIPQAVVSRHYQVLVNGFAVSVPYSRLPDLLDARFAEHVYPSLTYTLDLNRGPSVLGAPPSRRRRARAATG